MSAAIRDKLKSIIFKRNCTLCLKTESRRDSKCKLIKAKNNKPLVININHGVNGTASKVKLSVIGYDSLVKQGYVPKVYFIA